MIVRLTYGAAAVTALFTVILFDALFSDTKAEGTLADLRRHGSLIPILFAFFSVAGALELVRMMRSKGLRPARGWAVVGSAVVVLAPWLISGLLQARYPSDLTGGQWMLAVIALALGGTVVFFLRRRDLSGALADVGATWTVLIYAGVLPSFALQLRCHHYIHGPDGAWLILIFLAVVKSSDIGAYFVGSAIGRHRLIPWVSPKKTIEGAVGGIASAVGVTLLAWFAFEWSHVDSDETIPLIHTITEKLHALSLTQATVFAVLMAICGQLGDLLESIFKRSAGAKDSASLLPGFGGVLDLMDSPVLAAPVAWFLLTCVWPVV
ncbi:MAG: phosphatidate cytidylyltransferase [bacterium]|nr:phosphatidate cytidylyltransferase [bacterium]